jgi:predicted helicase
MSSELQKALEIIREKANNSTEVGTAFERLSKIFLENDPTWTQQFSEVWFYEDWAKTRDEYPNKDVGIDLVAKLRGEEGYCSIQCKCYQSTHFISKADIDSFISASNTKDFSLLLLIDTSIQEIDKNAKTVFDNLTQDWKRIQLSEMEQCRIDWLTYVREDRVRLHSQKTLFDHQAKALEAVREGLAEDDRGKIIMACGTGKTFTSLRIAEDLAGNGKRVLYMVPSLALMSQTVREWKNDAVEDFTAFSACSDIRVGTRGRTDDSVVLSLNDLAFPATTDAAKLAEQIKNADSEKMTVVFSTYHSIDVISRAQFEYDLDEFDLIICDEAHRTTGATLVGDDESNFVRIHSNENVSAKKRLYMTATPRIFGETAKKKADEGEVALASMDDEDTYGKTLFHRGFGWAVENNHLTDYKVVVLAVDEGIVADHIQRSWEEGSELKLDDATKMIGCYKALAKIGFMDGDDDREKTKLPSMKRAIAFCQTIALSKMFSSEFMTVVNEYIENEDIKEEHKTDLEVELHHVDGTFNAERRNDRLNWLKDDTDKDVCRVLTNARCLSEGVDVPSLDAIMFLHPRKSQIDVVQSVGRVMRKAKGKDLGYVILPITVAPGVSAERALNDNEKYKVVWQILNALRAHDERLDGRINQMGLGEDVSDRIEIVGVGFSDELDATTAVVEDVAAKPKPADKEDETDTGLGGEQEPEPEQEEEQLAFVMNDLSQAIKAKIVDKCGTRDYWEDWASDIAKIAQAHITRINSIVLNSGTPERKAFLDFLEEIRDDLNPEITETDAVEMLAQHIITRPVFDSLFQGNNFTKENAVSRAMETVLGQLYDKSIDTENKTLQKFYDSVKRRSEGLVTTGARQKLILELYDRFFRSAFKKMTEKLGIVYTPVEVVDFIIHSVNDVLKDEFGTSLSDKGVHILDPFTGTGTFITRLLESGLFTKEELSYKYKNEIHANEIVLLAYYIAAINIESVYQDLVKENQYQPFQGIVLTDTFQLYEQEKDMIANLLPDNSNRRTAQKERDITVVIGNPPYSAGQKLANDDAANISYLNLDERIAQTYVADSKATNKNALYDSYIRAFRWASDRVNENGVIAFVSGAGWVDRSFADGMRENFEKDFSKIYVLHLRGDIRRNMLSKGAAGEGENIFGQGSMTGISITILIKNTNKENKGEIHFMDIGKNLKKEQKLSILRHFKSINGISEQNKFKLLEPNENHDWLNQGDRSFRKYIPMGNKKDKKALSIFRNYSRGLESGRDAWVYNSSKTSVKNNYTRQIDFYNSELTRLITMGMGIEPNKFVNNNPKNISWTSSLFQSLKKQIRAEIGDLSVGLSIYRPFTKQLVGKHKLFIHRFGQMNNIFPTPNSKNRVIAVTGIGPRSGMTSLQMFDEIPDLQAMDNGQCFPLKLYEKSEISGGLFDLKDTASEYVMTDGITDAGFQHFSKKYPNQNINKEDLFYYIYGLLHSEEYQEKFKNNILKELPRIPAVKSFEDFIKFSKAGRKLGDLHVNYEKAEPYQVTIKEGDLKLTSISDPKEFYYVKKMKFAGKRGSADKTTVIYNKKITIQNIPLGAYDYIVNGKSALDWVMDRQVVKTDKKSGLTNDANDYANETMNNPAYPLELFQRVITISLETMKIVRSLPKLDID